MISRILQTQFRGLTRQMIIVRSYNQNVIDYFENPPNVGSLKRKNKNVGTGVVGSMACGDQLKFQVEVGEDGIIKQAVFKAFGCGSAIASSAYATELVKGLHVNEASKITNESNNAVIIDIASYLKLPPVKRHCSLLAEEAIEMALKDFKTKNPEHQ